MHPYSIDMTIPHAERIVPNTQSVMDRPILPEDFTIEPGVANMPEPITRETTRMYALVQVRYFPSLSGDGDDVGRPSRGDGSSSYRRDS